MSCPKCKESAKFKEYRGKTVVSLLGEIRIPRGYYHCGACGAGHFPWDEILRLTARALTPGAEEVVSLLGSQNAFGTVAELTLRKAANIRLSESTVQRTTEDAGERVGKRLKAGEVFGPPIPWHWHRDRGGKTCGYVGIDATGVMMQGPDGGKADGRMAYVCMVFNPQPRDMDDDETLCKPCDGVRYLAGHQTLEELGPQMRRQAGQVGMDSADIWIALTDGGNGLENWIDVNFPGSVKILDFRHASEYLCDLAKTLKTGDDADALAHSWCHTMKHEGGRRILEELESLDRRTFRQAARDQYLKTTNYLRNNLHRMNYPAYLKRGWQIATGAVESACKTVVNQRLCMGGMRWCESGSDALCHLRALCRSDVDQWDEFWNHPTSRAAA